MKTLLNKGDYERAVADFIEAIRLEPDNLLSYHNRAPAYEKLGDKYKAHADRNEAAEPARPWVNP